MSHDYRASGPYLEALKDAIPTSDIRVGDPTKSGAKLGEYRFYGPGSRRSAWVQAPVTPFGRRRAGRGMWRFRLTTRDRKSEQWEHASTIGDVVLWLRRRLLVVVFLLVHAGAVVA